MIPVLADAMPALGIESLEDGHEVHPVRERRRHLVRGARARGKGKRRTSKRAARQPAAGPAIVPAMVIAI